MRFDGINLECWVNKSISTTVFASLAVALDASPLILIQGHVADIAQGFEDRRVFDS